MVGFFVHLTLALLAPILLALGFVLLIPRVLSVDDLSGCQAPEQMNARCTPVDAIVAISGGDTDARAQEAIRLYQQGWAPAIIFSGAAEDKQGTSNAAAMAAQAVGQGIPRQVILLDEASVNTADNASRVRPILEERGFKRIILVTSPYHQRRASIEFERRVGDLAVIVNHPTPTDRYWDERRWWTSPLSLWLGLSESVKLMIVSLGRG